MKKLLFCSLLLLAPKVFAVPFLFEVDFPEEKAEIDKRLTQIEINKKKIEDYWNINPEKPTIVQIKKYESNPKFFNCANLQNKFQIYIHSFKSLENLSSDNKKQMNSFCLDRSYDDLAQTIIHEYSHALHWQAQKTEKMPLKWIWEGLSVHLSGQLDTSLNSIAKSVVQKLKPSFNLCNTGISKDVYALGGAIVRHLEKKHPGIGREMIDISTQDELRIFFEKKNIPCLIEGMELYRNL